MTTTQLEAAYSVQSKNFTLRAATFDILKLKFEFIDDELWFVKVKHFKLNARIT